MMDEARRKVAEEFLLTILQQYGETTAITEVRWLFTTLSAAEAQLTGLGKILDLWGAPKMAHNYLAKPPADDLMNLAGRLQMLFNPENEGGFPNWYHRAKAAEARNQGLEAHIGRLREALEELVGAADTFSADQSGAQDPRCGLTQPVTVEEAEALNRGIAKGWAALSALDAEEVKR